MAEPASTRLLQGKRCLITGAASGIGRAVAERFVAEGARVAAFDLSEEGLSRLQKDVAPDIVAVRGDVRSNGDNERAVKAAADAFGGLDVFVGNAGLFDRFRNLSDLNGDEISAAFDEVFGVNVKGYLLGARAALPELARSGGAIVFTVSVAGFFTGGGGPIYTASKHAIVGLVRQLAVELAPSRIRVNGVAPGGTPTGLRSAPSLLTDEERATGGGGLDPVMMEERQARTSPIGISGHAEDHAPAYVFLASDLARAITGVIIVSDGGLHAPQPDRWHLA